MNSNNSKYRFSLIFFAPIFYLLFQIFNIDKQITIFTLIFILFFIFISIKKEIYEKKIILLKNKKQEIFFIAYFFVLILFTQNYLLEFELIDWDIASYIVASNEVIKGNIPYETQWESKGPILYYIYSFILGITSSNFIYFKIFSDLILFIIAIILFKSSLLISNKNLILSTISVSAFILFMSQPWAISSYSETFSLLFLSISIYILFYKNHKYRFAISGILFSISTLVNQGVILFLIPYLIYFYLNKSNKVNLINFYIALSIPHLFFIGLYTYKNLFHIYFATFYTIPLSYASANYSNFYELKIFFKQFLEYDFGIYFAIILILLILVRNLFIYSNIFSIINNYEIYFILSSLMFYFIGSHNYYHHLIYFIFFISLYISKFKLDSVFVLLISFILLSSFNIFSTKGITSYRNLINTEILYNNYPLKQLSEKLEEEIEGDFEVLSIDYNLILHYLDKPNFSYIVHGTNLEESYILSSLENINVISKNYLDFLKNSKPEVIICSSTMIVRGEPLERPFPCNLDHYPEYYQFDTSDYFIRNLNYYWDPYKEIKVFILK